MKTRNVARVYLKGGAVNRVVRTTPGRSVSFVGGAAVIQDERDMPFMLMMSDVQVEVETEYIDGLPTWLQHCPIGKYPSAPVQTAGIGSGDIHVGPPPTYEITRLVRAVSEPEPVGARRGKIA